MNQTPSRIATRAVLQKLLELLSDPEQDWSFRELVAYDRVSTVQIWLGNLPILDTNTHPVKMPFTLHDRYRLYQAVQLARANWMLKQLSKKPA